MKPNAPLTALVIAALNLPAVAAVPVFFFSPTTPYLSLANIPLDFYDGGSPTLLETLEDGSLDGSLTGSGGRSVIINTFSGGRDSVDADDGGIDGTCGPQTAGGCAS